MRVTMIFEFPDVNDANSEAADDIVEELTLKAKELQEEFNAAPPYKGYGDTRIWVDDAEGSEDYPVSDESRSYGPWHTGNNHV